MGDAHDIATLTLDAMRQIGVGTDAVLKVLDTLPGHGYQEVATAAGGWDLEDADAGGSQILYVCELDPLTRAVLAAARLFSVDGRVYKIRQDYVFASPSPGVEIRQWKYPVTPTGETFPGAGQ